MRADRLVERAVVPAIRETVQRTPRNALKPWLRQPWVISPAKAVFVAALEEVLEVYHRPNDVRGLGRAQQIVDRGRTAAVASASGPTRAGR
jgi:hypothetical protein